MFSAQVYRIMIGCPGDILEEVQSAFNVINRWTTINAEQHGIVLLPIHWSTNSFPEHGAHPQKILNTQLVCKSDMLVGIFGARLGSPTDTSESGTIEEIEKHISSGKPVMLFFRKVNDKAMISSQDLARMESFRNSIKDHCLFKEYDTCSDFEKVFSNALELFLTDRWLKETPQVSGGIVELSINEKKILKKWSISDVPDAYYVSYKGGTIYVIGNEQVEVTKASDLVRWKNFFSRLEESGLIEVDHYNRYGNPVYHLRKQAYDYTNSIDNNKFKSL